MPREPQQCMECGGLLHSTKIPTRLTVKGRRFAAPGDCSEDEHVQYCPWCGEEESFEPKPMDQDFQPFVKTKLIEQYGPFIGTAAWEVAVAINDSNIRPTPRNIASLMDQVNDLLPE